MPTNINFNKTLGVTSKGASIVLPSNTAGPEMIFTITTTTANETFQLSGNTGGGITYNYDIDWGDGTPIENVTSNIKVHTYVTPGVHEIKLTGEIYIRSNTDASKWTEFKQWGSNVIIYGCMIVTGKHKYVL
jgi:PKD repeat protein